MKRVLGVAFMMAALSLDADVNMKDKATVGQLGLAGLKESLASVDKREAGRYYLYHGQSDKYEKVKEDEFELDGAIDEAYQELVEKVNSNQSFIGQTSVLRLSAKIGKYDFKTEKFPVNAMTKDSYISYDGNYKLVSSSSTKHLQLSFDNIKSEDAFISMPKAEAKEFVKNSKDRNGNVNRKITAVYTYTIKSITSKIADCNRHDIRWCALVDNPKVIGHVTKLEFFDTKNNLLQTYTY